MTRSRREGARSRRGRRVPEEGDGPGKSHTPVMRQYLEAKSAHPDALLFFRMGDFYELFFEDAILAAELLDIQLTARGTGPDGQKIPMAGVPHHAATGYVARLLELGRNVALCEQMEDPAHVKGPVPREVVRVVTPGLCLEPESLDARAENWLVALATAPPGASPPEAAGPDDRPAAPRVGLAALELSTSELRACVLPGPGEALAELVRLEPAEVLLDGDGTAGDPFPRLIRALETALPRAAVRRAAPAAGDPTDDGDDRRLLDRLFGPEEADRLGGELAPESLAAVGRVVRYAQAAHPREPLRIPRVVAYDPGDRLVLDDTAVRNLELVRTLDGDRRGSLLHLLDETRTPMGARLLRRRLSSPSLDLATIRRRHDAVDALVADADLREALRGDLGAVGDLERLATRIALGMATPRELGALRDGLEAAARVADTLAGRPAGVRAIADALTVPEDLLGDVRERLRGELVDEPPLTGGAGGVFREGVDPELDELRGLSSSSKEVILQLEARERRRTGIGSLKVKFTRVFGYYIEVTKSNLHAVPDDYRRKQTVAGGERFVTDELDELQTRILQADERARSREQARFEALRREVAAAEARVRALAGALADLDVHAALARVAHRHRYVRPEVDDSHRLELIESRHPVVEQLAEAGSFVPNDVTVDADGDRLLLITGPNMAGKSTVMRQTALAVIMAQAGSFVAADQARIGRVDRVFTRVGASDNLGGGESTFMVEMRETAEILRHATRRSLLVLDEIGRGTSTYDGLSIAWAVVEHLHDAVGCRALFATHYHELCRLADDRSGIVNVNVAAQESGDEVIFLHRLLPGGANRSYGIAVARLAGVPELVLARARQRLAELERRGQAELGGGSDGGTDQGGDRPGRADGGQLALFPTQPPAPLLEALEAIDVDRLTPVEALVALARLKALAGGRRTPRGGARD
ncbi:MAG TPA: DNA mismatch repair protein MutS [Polyangiaceae bacterium LLY-WYZ-14_1]|nr:DNA mismatch repair protein MutS [Polyangiaceae bacterium LLY-WYZ-14_1]